MRTLPRLLAALTIVFAPALPASAQGLDIPEGGYVVSSDLGLLPDAVREKVLELRAIAQSGDISRLKPILEADRTTVSFGGPEDPTAYLIEESADKQGIETLAILGDILEAPFAAGDGGDGSAYYVWPSLAAYEGFAGLTPADRVVAYQIMGYEGFEEMKGLDAWYYWRVYIGEDGQLQAFVAGD